MDQINANAKDYSLTDGYLLSCGLQQQHTGKVKKKENTHYSDNTFCAPKSSLLPPPEQSPLCLVNVCLRQLHCRIISNTGAEGIAKTEISPDQTISAPPCPTTKIHRFGWSNGVCAGGFCHVLSIRDHTSSHPKSPEPQQQKEYHSPCLSCVLPFEVSPAQLWKA